MSFLKYTQDGSATTGNGRGRVHFDRSEIDGVPYRGAPLPLREEEYAEVCEVVWDAHSQLFDMSVPEDKAKFDEVVDRIANGWYKGMKEMTRWGKDENGKPTILVWLVWGEPFQEPNPSKVRRVLGGSAMGFVNPEGGP